MLCCKCNKNLAVVYITKIDNEGKTVNEGYCLTCAKELNLGPVNQIMENMGINAEEMDGLNREMSAMMEEMGGDFNLEEGMRMISGDNLDDEDADATDENMSRSMQKNPFEMMSKLFGGKSETENSNDNSSSEDEKKAKDKKKTKKKKMLDNYGVNLTAKAKAGLVDRVISRDKELERTIQILNRRNKNNPCLIGEPGVGKTAIAEGLALKISQGEVPAKLLNYEIYLLDMAAVVAGTQFRGKFES